MTDKDVYKLYLQDLGKLITEIVETHKAEKRDKIMADQDIGYEIALYEVVSLLQNQALAFQIDLSEIHLDKIDPDKDLLTYKDK